MDIILCIVTIGAVYILTMYILDKKSNSNEELKESTSSFIQNFVKIHECKMNLYRIKRKLKFRGHKYISNGGKYVYFKYRIA